jgi:hypothetical protein
MATIEDRLAALEHHALLTSTEALSGLTTGIQAATVAAESVRRDLAELSGEVGARFDSVDVRLANIEQLLVGLAARLGPPA